MRLKKLQQVNFTAVYNDRINHSVIKTDDIARSLGANDNEQKTVFEAPGVKVIILPQLKKEVVLEANRVVLNDNSGSDIGESSLPEDFYKLSDKLPGSVGAYGFNYTIIIESSEAIDFSDFLSDHLKQVFGDIIGSGVTIKYGSGSTEYTMQLAPAGIKTEMIVSLNVNYASREIPPSEDLSAELTKNYEELTKKVGAL